MKKCPICRQSLEVKEFEMYKTLFACENNCFRLVESIASPASNQYKIFDEEFIILYIDSFFTKIKKTLKIKKKIRYWKKNDRYLSEIIK